MRIAVFSDIHANRAALTSVLRDAEKAGVEEYWFLGDVLGYGPEPLACLEMMEGLGRRLTSWVIGNHDAWWFDLPGMRPQDGASADALWALGKGAEELGLPPPRPASNPGWKGFDWLHWQLRSLPVNPSVQVYLVHGLQARSNAKPPWVGYLRTARDAFELLQVVKEQQGCSPAILLTGHTHVPRLLVASRQRNASIGLPEPLSLPWRGPIPLDWERNIYFVNPGSAGMPPRNRSSGQEVTYAVLDDGDATVEFRRVVYPVQKTVKAMQKKEFRASLIELFQGDQLVLSCNKDSYMICSGHVQNSGTD